MFCRQLVRCGLVLVMAVCFSITANAGNPPIDPATYARELEITFSGYDKPDTLTNFPVLVVFSNNAANGFNYLDFASTNGYDLRFMDAAQTQQLNFEIEDWNTNGASYVWVQIPALSSNTTIHAYMGNPDAASAPASYTTNGSTWSEGFAGVWHFREKSGTRAPDSSPFSNTGAVARTTWTSAKVDGGLDFAENNYVDCGLAASLCITGAMSVSGWTYCRKNDSQPAFDGSGRQVIGKQGWQNDRGWALYNQGGPMQFGISPDGTNMTVVQQAAATNELSVWAHWAGVFDPGVGLYLYQNGGLDNTNTTAVPTSQYNSTCHVIMGRRAPGNAIEGFYNGIMDEVRIATVPRSATWIWAEWMNSASNAVFNTSRVSPSNPTPVVVNAGFANVSATGADLFGSLLSTGTAATTVYVYYGTADGGAGAAGWTTNICLGVDSDPVPPARSYSAGATDLFPETRYYFRYMATNVFKGYWTPEAATFLTGFQSGHTPSNLTAVQSAGSISQVQLQWTENFGVESGFVLQRWGGGSSVTGTTIIGSAGATGWVDTVPLMGETYHYRIAATNSSGLGDWSATASVTPAMPSFDHRLPITLSGYSPSERLTNFPALVVLDTNRVDFGTFSSTNGLDLRFLDATMTRELNYEIELWQTNSRSYAWVQIPELSATTSIWACWGNTNLTARLALCRTNGATWSEGFAGVWHLKEGAGTSIRDSSPYHNDGSIANATWTNAPVNGGLNFANNNCYANVGQAASLRITGALTVSTWAYGRRNDPQPLNYGSGRRMVTKLGGPADRGWDLTNEGGPVQFGVSASGASLCSVSQAAGTNDLNVWAYWTGVYDPGIGVYLYQNGNLDNSNTTGVPVSQYNSTCNVIFGRRAAESEGYFDGMLDEIRVSSVPRSAGWIRAEWLNMMSNSVLNSYAPVQPWSTDASGIPDSWKTQYFGTAIGPGTGPQEDWDGDGMVNYAEWKAGTIPADRTSSLYLSRAATLSGTNFVITWQSVTNKLYTIEGTTNLLYGFTEQLALHILATPPENVHTVRTDQASQSFFRIVLE